MSNLLDKSSIVLTPTAYDNGKVLCVKPSDGSGDFDFSRNSAATRVNAQGLVEDVQILSSNLVQNGDFSEQGAEEVSNGSFSQQGSELVTGGDFSNPSDWTKEVGWTISGGTANYSGGSSNRNIRQAIGITNGKTYKIQYQVTAITSGEVACRFGGMSGVDEITATTTGTYVGYITANSSVNGELLFEDNDNNFVGSIDNCSVVEVGQDWDLGANWSISEDKIVSNASGLLQQSTSELTSGKTYKASFEITEYTSGGVKLYSGSGLDTSTYKNTVGTHVFNFVANGTTTSLYSDNFIGSVTNISVKEVGQNWDLTQSTISNDKLTISTSDGSYASARQFSALVVGKNYFYSIDVDSITNGSISVSNSNINISTSGVSTGYFVSNTTTAEIKRNTFGSATNAVVNSFSVIEITDDTNLPRINYEGFSYQDALGSELITNGDFATDTNWIKGTGWTISGGSANASSATSDFTQTISYTLGKTYRVTYTISNYSSGSVRTLLGAYIAGTSRSSNGTFIEDITPTNPSSNSLFYIEAQSVFTGSIDNVSVKEVTGQEVVPDSGCGSWLFEPQSTNLITYSEDFSNASWAKSSTTVVDDASTSPDGTINASSIEIPSGEFMYFTHSATINIGDKWTWSCFVKSSDQKISWGGGTPDGTDVYSIETLSNGWYRHILQRTFIASGINIQTMFSEAVAGTDLFYIYGAQLEALSYSTSYIPTDGTTVTRNQDVCNNGGSATSINSTEGVLYAEIKTLTELGLFRQINLNDGTTANRIYISKRANNGNLEFRMDNSLGSLNFSISKNTTNNYVKVAFRYGLNNFAVFIDGVNQNVNPTGNTFSANTFNNLEFTSPINQNFFGKTKCLAVWKEPLSDEELAELTTI